MMWGYVCCCLISNSCSTLLQPHGLQPTRLLCQWDFSSKNTGVGCHFLLQGIFPTPDQTQVSCIGRQILYHWVTSKVTYRPHIILNGNVIEGKARSPYKHPIKLQVPQALLQFRHIKNWSLFNRVKISLIQK